MPGLILIQPTELIVGTITVGTSGANKGYLGGSYGSISLSFNLGLALGAGAGIIYNGTLSGISNSNIATQFPSAILIYMIINGVEATLTVSGNSATVSGDVWNLTGNVGNTLPLQAWF